MNTKKKKIRTGGKIAANFVSSAAAFAHPGKVICQRERANVRFERTCEFILARTLSKKRKKYHPFTTTFCQGKADVVFEIRGRNLGEKQGFVNFLSRSVPMFAENQQSRSLFGRK